MSELARKRWKLLGDILTNRRCAVNDATLASVSVRRFETFGLLTTTQITELDDAATSDTDQNDVKHIWYRYTCPHVPNYSALIRHLDSQLNLSDLLGFNNTGNVCVWPSEEVLTYYCLRNQHLFSGKTVCELGGGMTCLAAVAVSVCCDMQHVVMTDGNQQSVSNIGAIINRNRTQFHTNNVEARLLRWDDSGHLADLNEHFDWIICADCLFFDDFRSSLTECIYRLLKPNGQVLLFAPSRGTTFQQFVDLATTLFKVTVCTDRYDDFVWTLHQQNMSKGIEVYDETLHYPRLLQLKKPAQNESLSQH